jgi:protease-4
VRRLVLLAAFFIVGFALIVWAIFSSSSVSSSEKIGLIKVEGLITDAKETVENLKTFTEDDTIKAIVIRIDSPGGAVAPSQEIYDQIKEAKKKKKVLISMANLAASGGYYIASQGDKIIANPGTLTGSIGVIMEIPNVEDLMRKIGIKNDVIKSGLHKDIGSMYRDISPEDRQLLQGLLDDVHEQFIKAVAEGRKMNYEKVKQLADGRIFTGKQAKENGLVDELGGLEYTINLAAKLAKIEGKPEVVELKKKDGILNIFEKLTSKLALVDQFHTLKLQYKLF